MKRILLITLLAWMASACTGTRFMANPDPAVLEKDYANAYETVGVRGKTSEGSPDEAGDMVADFAYELRTSRFAEGVYTEIDPGDDVSVMLESSFDVTVDRNSASNTMKSVLTGLTLFLLEPVFWYKEGYELEGEVVVMRDGERLGTVEAQTNVTIQLKYFSMSERDEVRSDALSKRKTALYRKLMTGIASKLDASG